MMTLMKPMLRFVPRRGLLLALLVLATNCKSRPSPTAGASATDAARYKFSSDWFNHVVADWPRLFAPLQGRPNLNYLEIGVFEGRSLIWMLENVLTHSTARATGIDIFPSNSRQILQDNLDASGSAGKVTTITGNSWREMRKLPLESFDIIYVDGSHLMSDVLSDAVNGWALLKPGGIMLFDDYWADPGLPDETNAVAAIDAFLTAHRNDANVVLRTKQVALQKISDPCTPDLFGNREVCSSVEGYAYYWRFADPGLRDAVYKTVDGKRTRFPLTTEQRVLLEKILATRRFGQKELSITDALRGDPAFESLCSKLGLTW
jgi:predicted O-methyltransferase YrrM